MKIPGKAFIAPAGLVVATTSAAVCMNQYSMWLSDHPIAKTWLDENNYTEKTNVKDFEQSTRKAFFSLGCHRVIFGGRNFRRLYDDKNPESTSSSSSSVENKLSDSISFGSDTEPFVGCSTAYKRKESNKNIYEYEVALKQGEKGFSERISVYDDKIVSQIIFFERNDDGKKIRFPNKTKQTPPYKFVFGLYKYIKQTHQETGSNNNVYKWGNPETNQWTELNLTESSTGADPLYYSIWSEDSEGKGIFENLGVKYKDSQFSSLVKLSASSDTNESNNFFYFNRSDFTAGSLRTKPNPTPKRYSLSVLDSLIDELSTRKGSWKSVESFCQKQKSSLENRVYINEIKKLAQYCYALPKPQIQKKV